LSPLCVDWCPSPCGDMPCRMFWRVRPSFLYRRLSHGIINLLNEIKEDFYEAFNKKSEMLAAINESTKNTLNLFPGQPHLTSLIEKIDKALEHIKLLSEILEG